MLLKYSCTLQSNSEAKADIERKINTLRVATSNDDINVPLQLKDFEYMKFINKI